MPKEPQAPKRSTDSIGCAIMVAQIVYVGIRYTKLAFKYIAGGEFRLKKINVQLRVDVMKKYDFVGGV